MKTKLLLGEPAKAVALAGDCERTRYRYEGTAEIGDKSYQIQHDYELPVLPRVIAV